MILVNVSILNISVIHLTDTINLTLRLLNNILAIIMKDPPGNSLWT